MRLLLFSMGHVCLVAAGVAQQPAPTADAIMAQVAAHQDQSEAQRIHYLYVQHARVTSSKGKTLRCEEITDTRITPLENGSHQELLKLDGRLLVKHRYVTYTQLPKPKPTETNTVDAKESDLHVSLDTDGDMDRDLVEHMRANLTNDRSRDGIGAHLFPLTSKTQSEYRFQLVGQEHMNGREVFHIVFQPKDKEDYGWKGDAYVDTTAYQPVLVRTTMSRKIPFAVRTLLGTSLPGLGFTVIYAPQAGDVWFPISFGTEFKLHVFFFLNRDLTVSAQNQSFEKTHVSSTIVTLPQPLTPRD